MEKAYLERLKETVQINAPHADVEAIIWKILDVAKPIIFDGHFELLSKKHTDTFFRFAAITQYPYFISQISKEMVKWLTVNGLASSTNVILSPSSQGMFFAYDIARELNGTRAVYASIDKETGYPRHELIDGFEIKSGENVLIVNDMTTTGTGVETLIKLAEKRGANVLGVCLFANRGNGEKKVEWAKSHYNFHSILDLNMPSWDKKDCSSKCQADKPLIKATELHHLPIYADANAYERYAAKLKVA